MEKLKEINNITIYRLEINVGDTNHITNCYIIVDENTKQAVLIDPADKYNDINLVIKKLEVTPKVCLITHAHADHIGALEQVIKGFKDIKVYAHELDINALNNKFLNEQDAVGIEVETVEISKIIKLNNDNKISVGNIDIETIYTPGHTEGSVSFYESTSDSLFTGDTIFENTYGRTDLKMGSSQDMKKSLERIFDSFGYVDTYAGHGEPFKLEDVKRKIRLIYAFKG